MKMTISIVIPVYNEANYLQNCLNSLQKQVEKPDEIIIVNNNSADETINIAKKYPVRLTQELKQGIVNARNKGFNEAKYDIIARTDADVILPQDWIKRIKENFQNNKIDALTGSAIFIDLPFRTTFYTDFYLNLMKFIQRGDETLNGPNLAITKKIWDKVKNKVCSDDKQVHEDVDLAYHILQEDGIIKRDQSLIIEVSARRIKNNPLSFFIEYPIRLIKTLKNHSMGPFAKNFI